MCKDHRKTLNKNNLNPKALYRSKNKERRKFLQHIYNSKRWKQLRKEYISEHPVCERCGQPATTVHHKKRFSTGINKKEMERLAYDMHNLQALCMHCHLSAHRRIDDENPEIS